jgi:succinate dehydrogenase/fumarate reductase flavoprotein subunit
MSEAPHVLVLGTGGAGFTAALSAHEAGARVSLVRKGRAGRRDDRLVGRDDLDPEQSS